MRNLDRSTPTKKSVSRATIVVSMGLLAATATNAQEMEIPQDVAVRAQPQINALGVPLGRSFRLYPKVAILGGYDTNILATETDELSGGRITIAPSVYVQSEWSRHELNFSAFLESRTYPTESQQNYIDWGAGTAGRLDVLDTTNIVASANYQRLTEDRSGIDVLEFAPKPSNYRQADINLGVNHAIDQFTISVGGSYTYLEYLRNRETFRDRGIARGAVQLAYTFSPGYSVFVRGTGNNRDFFHRDGRVLGSPYQSSAGYSIVGGVSSEITNLVAGELWVGYLDQMYFSDSFKDASGVSFGADIYWFATAITTVTLYGGREVVDATTGTAGGIFFSTVGIAVEHFLLNHLILNAGAEYYNGDYVGSPRDDDGFRVDAGVRYLLNRYVTLEALYRFDNRNSNFRGQSFDRHQVDFGFVFQI